MNREKSIEMLNKAVAEELLSTIQYLYFHFHCADKGYMLLADIFMRISIVEMKHIDILAERILFLKGDVDMVPAGATQKIRNVEEMLKFSCKLEEESINDYNKWANEAGKLSDSATKTLFEKLIVAEEEHYDIFDTELGNLKTFGDNYLSLQAISHSKEAAKGHVEK
jgi:ferritin dps family protein